MTIFVLSLALCYFVLVFFSPFSIAITSLGEERANLSAYVCSICACLVLSVYSSSLCLGRAAACDCGTSWTFLLPFFFITSHVFGLASADSFVTCSIIPAMKPF